MHNCTESVPGDNLKSFKTIEWSVTRGRPLLSSSIEHKIELPLRFVVFFLISSYTVITKEVRLVLEQFSNECRKTKTSYYSNQSKQKQDSKWTNQKSKKIQVISIKRGKTRANKSRLVLVLRTLRKWRELFNQSQGKVKQNQSKHGITFDTVESCSISFGFLYGWLQ